MSKLMLILMVTGLTDMKVQAEPQHLTAENSRSAILDETRYWDLDDGSIASFTASDEKFGTAFAKGDFNGDGTLDLAVSIPEWDASFLDSGAVFVMYGDTDNLTGTNGTLIFQSNDSNEGDAAREEGDRFGTSLASGDFNNDGYDDLAVGSPHEDIDAFPDAGGVHIFSGSVTGISTTATHFLTVGAVVLGEVNSFDRFGRNLTVGDYNNDNYDDLVVSIEGQDWFINNILIQNAGEVRIYYGSQQSISSSHQSLSQENSNIGESAEDEDNFGSSLESGDFNGDGFSDLVIGASGESYNNQQGAGIVHVIHGTPLGVGGAVSNQIWGQNSLSIETEEAFDFFGSRLAAGDFNGDGKDDLAIGANGEDFSAISAAGVVHVIYASNATGFLGVDGHQIFSQNVFSTDIAEAEDYFGDTLSSGDIDMDGFDELFIGVPLEDFEGTSTVSNNGMVHITYGGVIGLTTSDEQWHYGLLYGNNNNLTLPDLFFGKSIIFGNFGKGPTLIVGMPGRVSADNDVDAGAFMEFIYETPDLIFVDGFEDLSQVH